jgi:hypothetical protein
MEDHLIIIGKGSYRTVTCKYCTNSITSNNKDRWRSHLANCSSAPSNVQLSLKKIKSSTVFVESSTSALLEELTEESICSETASSKQVRIQNWIDRVNKKDEEDLDLLFGNCFFHTGMPFRFADSDSLKKFIRRARPAYNLPSSKKVAGSIFIIWNISRENGARNIKLKSIAHCF